MSASPEDRLIEIETRLAFQERMVEDLSEIAAEQAGRIETLTLLVSRLKDRLIRLEQGGETSPWDEKPPPHY
ncbi:protein SlyX [Alphaproteobacteria bacterium]|nr:protein SlyX [Alphaproteobacteria bacterium]